MMWTALAMRLFVVIKRAISVTFKAVKLGHRAPLVRWNCLNDGKSPGRPDRSPRKHDATDSLGPRERARFRVGATPSRNPTGLQWNSLTEPVRRRTWSAASARDHPHLDRPADECPAAERLHRISHRRVRP